MVQGDLFLNDISNSVEVFNNFGTVRKTSGTAAAVIEMRFNVDGTGANEGVVDIQSGTLTLEFEGGNLSGGTFTEATVQGAGTFQLTGGGGDIYTFDTATTLPVSKLTITSGMANFSGALTLQNMTVAGGTLTADAAMDVDVLTQSGGALTGIGAVSIGTTFNWSDGVQTGDGVTTILAGATATLSGTAQFTNDKVLGRRLINEGTIDYTGARFFFGPTNGSVGVIDNNGVFNATGDGDFDDSFASASHAFNNAGTFNRSGAGTTSFIGIRFNNTGAVNVQEGTLDLQSAFSNFSGTTLTGGAYNVTGRFQFVGANIVTNAANIVLDGAASAILNRSTSADALANFGTNAAAGSFTIQNGRNFTTVGAFTNAGNATIGPNSTLATGAGGSYTQTDGSTTLVASTSTLDPGGSADIQAGSLGGFGTVLGNLQHAGQVSPGASPGTITLDGSYTQTGGALNIEIGGMTAGSQFDQLVVTGNVNLGGALNVTLIGGFVLATGDSFRILDNTGAMSGTFTNLPEGAILTVGIAKFHISYAGGTGNDVVLTAINLEPTLDAIPDPAAILEDAGQQAINLSGITAGGNQVQSLTVTAESSNPALIPNPTISYTSPNTTGSIVYTPVGDQSGTAVITVTVKDDGGTANGGINNFSRTFTLTVTSVNDAPTLATIADPAAILEDAGQQNINFSGISAGSGETQTLTVTATSDNTALIPNPSVTYTSSDSTGSLSYTPVANQSGAATITVTVTDDGGTANGGVNTFSRTFTVTVNPVNDAPTVAAPFADLTVNEDAAPVLDHAILDAVFADVDNLDSDLTYAVTATTPGGIATATIDADDTLDLSFVADASGEVDITVRATDPSGLFAEDTFHVTVHPVNDAPTVASPIADRIVPTSSPPVLNHADLNAVFADIDDADSELSYTVSANTNAGLVTVTIEADDTLDLSFAAAENGVADITVRATDPDGLFVEDTFHIFVTPPVATTTIIKESSPNPSTFGQAITFTVSVTPAEGTDLPTGTVTFKDGSTTLGASTLANVGGVATAVFTTEATQLGAGSHAITAVCSGVDTFITSTSAEFGHTVNKAAATATSTQATPSPSIIGQTVTFTVSVAPSVGGVLPTGTLTIMNGGVTLSVSTALTNVNGVATATFTTTPGQLGVGTHAITAVYAGDVNFAASTSAGIIRTINPLTALADTYTAKMNRRLKVLAAVGVLLNDLQASGLVKLVKKPLLGTLKLNADGSFTYTPVPGFLGKVTFKYRITSAFGASANAVVTIRVKR